MIKKYFDKILQNEVYKMLLEFKTNNFKSFLDEMDFRMMPAPKQKGLDHSILLNKVKKKEYKGLSSAVIYGPNASGKTNIISAMDVFKSIIIKGNIRNSDESYSSNISAIKLELIPNNTNHIIKPTSFYIKFIENNMLVEYELVIDLGLFFQKDYNRKILREKLSVNEKSIYTRTNNIEFGEFEEIESFMINGFKENESSAKILARNNLDEKELFLNNGFKMLFSSKFVNFILGWLEDKFLVYYRADTMEMNRKVVDAKQGTVYIEKTINDAAKRFGINSNALGYVVPKDGQETQLCSIFNDINIAIPAECFESYGTVRFINMFPIIIKALVTGAVLVLDEFDANIHPVALMNIINLFHNDDINKKQAQLIFNTHNPIFLNPNLFRRDEIKFVERDEDTHLSVHYALSDFKTAGSNGVRKTEDYMGKYFLGRYGAIKDVDFYDLFESIINDISGELTND